MARDDNSWLFGALRLRPVDRQRLLAIAGTGRAQGEKAWTMALTRAAGEATADAPQRLGSTSSGKPPSSTRLHEPPIGQCPRSPSMTRLHEQQKPRKTPNTKRRRDRVPFSTHRRESMPLFPLNTMR